VAAAGADAAPVVLSCRNLTAIYDVSTAINAFGILAAVAPQARMIIAGDGVERAPLEQQALRSGLADRIEFLGNVDHDDMAAVRARATIVLNTSRVDNQPVSLLEALAAGLPVVSTDAGGIAGLLNHDVDALLAPVGDARALGAHLCRLVTDPDLHDRLARAGRQRARSFRWGTVRAQWYRLYGELLERNLPLAPAVLRPAGEDGVRP
jgi:glycosyltransferase involved in cell wall biosynthesis